MHLLAFILLAKHSLGASTPPPPSGPPPQVGPPPPPGLPPINFSNPTTIPPPPPTFIAIEDWTPGSEFQPIEDYLPLREGEFIFALPNPDGIPDEGWKYGKNSSGNRGWYPPAYVTEASSCSKIEDGTHLHTSLKHRAA